MVILLPNLAPGPVCLTTMDGLPGSGLTQSFGHSSCPLMAQKDPKKTKMYNENQYHINTQLKILVDLVH